MAYATVPVYIHPEGFTLDQIAQAWPGFYPEPPPTTATPLNKEYENMTDRQDKARNAVTEARATLEHAEKSLTREDARNPYTTDELIAQLIEAVTGLHNDLPDAVAGFADAQRSIAEAHSGYIGESIHTHAKILREALGQHRIATEQAVATLTHAHREHGNRTNLASEAAANDLAKTITEARDAIVDALAVRVQKG